ncbi:MAG TPA: SRPBCC family protein [Verrucomicrobiae bacterium]|jgi:uncharacterized protein YndB with AHSA1/START domain|nr:SRPBCC family protein [Verrucomicrobiae bacterium]
MKKPDFVYTTYIKSTPEKVWQALTTPEFTRQYWKYENISDWKKGSDWVHRDPNGEKGKNVFVEGKVLESSPPNRLVLSWIDPANKADESRVTFEIKLIGELVRLDVVHGDFKADTDMPERISGGWPRVLSGLKTLLETGKAIDIWTGHKTCSENAAVKTAVS